MTKKDFGWITTRLLNHIKLTNQLCGDREAELARINRMVSQHGEDGGLLEGGLRLLKVLAETAEDEDVRLKAADAVVRHTIAIQDAIQDVRVRIAELTVKQQQHVDKLHLRHFLSKSTHPDAEVDTMSDEDLKKAAQ